MSITAADTVVFTNFVVSQNSKFDEINVLGFVSNLPLVKIPGATTLIIDNVHCSNNSYSNDEVHMKTLFEIDKINVYNDEEKQ